MAVSLKEWGNNLGALQKMHQDCMADDSDSPEVDHEAARKLYRDGLALFGEKIATAQDSRPKYDCAHSLANVFPARETSE